MRIILFVSALVAAGPALAQTSPSTPAPATGAASGTATTAPAASAAAQLKVGATVVDATGGQVGTIDQVNAGVVVVNTGTNKVGVPLGNFAAGPNGPVLGNTKAQLDAAAAQAQAQAQAQLKTLLVAGTDVHGTGGMVLGKVKAADDKLVTVTTEKGDVRLPISGFAAAPNGLVVGLTAAQFDAAVAAAKGAK